MLLVFMLFFFFKQKTAYEMRISDWSSDVCSSDLLMMDAFLTCRLVVDTGMNTLGWSLEQAREYMREHSFMSEREIESETLRYSCGIPGQSLAYKLGDRQSVVQGKSVSVRVDLGGRRIIKKKKHTQTYKYNN